MRQAGRDTVAAGRVPPTRADGRPGGGPNSQTLGQTGGRRERRPSGRRAAARFQLACVRLAWSGPKDGTAWALDELAGSPAGAHEVEAARALVEMADAGDSAALRGLLRPDPARPAISWSVACYRIGDLVPHALRDFTDPIDAVTTLADCGDADHLAAELVASTADGLCWVPLVRTGDRLWFQPFGRQSLLERPGRHGRAADDHGVVESARAHWAEVVASWYSRQGPVGRITAEGSADEVALSWADDSAGTGELVGGRATASLGATAPQPWTGAAGPDIAATLEELADAVVGIAEVVERLERTLGAVASRLEGLVPSPSAGGVRSSGPRRFPVAGPAADPDPWLDGAAGTTGALGTHGAQHAHHWWTPKHRTERQRSTGDAAPEPR